MVQPPQPLAIALERGYCRYVHLTMQFTIPPAAGGAPAVYINLPNEEITGIAVDFPNFPALNVIRALVSPPYKDYVWRTFALSWGELYPAGTSLDLVITHGQFGMILHADPFIHSLVDEPYPHSLTLMRGRPEILILENTTADSQTIDISLHLMAFPTKDDWDNYQDLLTTPNVTGGTDLSSTNQILRNILKEIKEGLRAIPVLWKKKVE
jgi:hypothetical protein